MSPAVDRAVQPGGITAGFRIVAPVNSPEEVGQLAAAGADELYCSVLPAAWSNRYGDWDSLSRRQGSVANLASLEELQKVARSARSADIPASLALNVGYTADQIPEVLDLASAWEEAGGTAVIVSSLTLLIRLQQRKSQLRRHISLLANVTNSRAVAFFHGFGATRIILPRDLAIPEMAAITSRRPDLAYEAMALNEKCRFIDGLCGFYHGTMFPDDTAAVFSYEPAHAAGLAVVYRHDLGYAGHGCQVPFVDQSGQPIPQPARDDVNHPACAACQLAELSRAGISFLKIGGRGLPTALKLRAVSFLRQAGELALQGVGCDGMRQLYRQTFHHACRASSCYYAGLAG